MNKGLRKDDKSLINRLKSIAHDAEFINIVTSHIHLPLIPNERSGSWYSNSDVSVYFKSTDGHAGQWDLNLKRMNLQALQVMKDGCIIVDVTTRGKRFPDALSKTIPIWCCVISRALVRYRTKHGVFNADWDTRLHTLASSVSQSEAAQIEDRLEGFVDKLMASSVDLSSIDKMLIKPLRPLWVHPATRMFAGLGYKAPLWKVNELPFIPIVCLSASLKGDDNILPNPNSFHYIQGAADDFEMYAPGLTPQMYHQHLRSIPLDSVTYDELIALIERCTARPSATSKAICNFIGVTQIAIGNRAAASIDCWNSFDTVINCGAVQHDYGTLPDGKQYIYFPIPEGKKGKEALFDSISVVRNLDLKGKVLVHCMQGKDRSVGIALSLLLLRESNPHDKKSIENVLLKIQKSHPIALPTRATMKKIHLYFIGREE
jgi:tRNA A64-2'-O-ribosylphosphate transferase